MKFENNNAKLAGGGIFYSDLSINFTLSNLSFKNNEATK